MTLTRRDLLRRTATAGLGLVVVNGLRPLGLVEAATAAEANARGYGPLRPDPQGLLDLPDGFSYTVLSVQGGRMTDGTAVPGRPDGMGTFAGPRKSRVIVRNHEQGASAAHPVVAPPALTYDVAFKGGTTTLLLDSHDVVVDERVSLGGTNNNCAGGVTPWGTWLTCEETETRLGQSGATKHHGYVFEVHPLDDSANVDPQPLTAMGRFAHEAVVVDPTTGDCYLTEDAGGPNGLVYRFEPNTRPGGVHSLRDGGTLTAMCVPGVLDLSTYRIVGTELPVTWKEVPDPSALGALGSTRRQFSWVDRSNRAAPVEVTRPGGDITRSRKWEGAWWGEGKAWLVASFARSAGNDWSGGAHDGQVWSYDPARAVLRLEAFFPVSPDPEGSTASMPDGPDNITVNPWGGVLLAEDGAGAQHIVAVTPGGDHTLLARNAVSDDELCGVVFAPDGNTLYVAIQGTGHTFAITGPFARLRRAR